MKTTFTSMNELMDYVNNPANYKSARKKQYEVWCCMPPLGTTVQNKLEGVSYRTDEKRRCVLSGTLGEQWVIDFTKLEKTYQSPTGRSIFGGYIQEKVVNGLVDWIKIATKSESQQYWALFIPSPYIFRIKTSWGDPLLVNNSDIPHGKGDFIVCTDFNGKPNLNDRWVVNGLVFGTTYNNRGWTDYLDLDTIEKAGEMPQPVSLIKNGQHSQENQVSSNTANLAKALVEALKPSNGNKEELIASTEKALKPLIIGLPEKKVKSILQNYLALVNSIAYELFYRVDSMKLKYTPMQGLDMAVSPDKGICASKVAVLNSCQSVKLRCNILLLRAKNNVKARVYMTTAVGKDALDVDLETYDKNKHQVSDKLYTKLMNLSSKEISNYSLYTQDVRKAFNAMGISDDTATLVHPYASHIINTLSRNSRYTKNKEDMETLASVTAAIAPVLKKKPISDWNDIITSYAYVFSSAMDFYVESDMDCGLKAEYTDITLQYGRSGGLIISKFLRVNNESRAMFRIGVYLMLDMDGKPVIKLSITGPSNPALKIKNDNTKETMNKIFWAEEFERLDGQVINSMVKSYIAECIEELAL